MREADLFSKSASLSCLLRPLLALLLGLKFLFVTCPFFRRVADELFELGHHMNEHASETDNSA